jgi:hypothetical protein
MVVVRASLAATMCQGSAALHNDPRLARFSEGRNPAHLRSAERPHAVGGGGVAPTYRYGCARKLSCSGWRDTVRTSMIEILAARRRERRFAAAGISWANPPTAMSHSSHSDARAIDAW